MCTHTKLIRNPYTRDTLRVNCGKCPACLQQKASFRANRIRNNSRAGDVTLFVTLTYKNEFIPYILEKDLADGVCQLPVYRQKNIRYIRKSSNYDSKLSYRPGTLLDTYYVEYPDDFDKNRFHLLKNDNSGVNRIGVIYYKDLQNFFKRLRINLDRHYGITEPFTFFACAEIGPTTGRAHFHTLIEFRKDYEKAFRSAILESWPYADRRRTQQYIELARDAASYVSSYVNRSSDFPSFFENNVFRPKHSYSHNYGMGNNSFGLSAILQKVDSGDMSYLRPITRDGVKQFVNVPIPEYVVNRFFPKFKGSTRIAPDQMANYLLHPSRLSELRKQLEYSDEDIYKIQVRLNHAKDYYRSITNKSVYDYVNDYQRVWRCRSSYILRHQYDDLCPSDFGYFYDNFNEFLLGKVRNFSLADLTLKSYEVNPNNLPWRQVLTYNLESLYHKMVKQRKVTNFSMVECGHDV